LSNSAELDEAEEKPCMGFIPIRYISPSVSNPNKQYAGLLYLKFLTAVFGLLF